MITIKNIKWKYQKFNCHNNLIQVLSNRISELKIVTKMRLVENEIHFNDVEKGMSFLSNRDNKVMMRDGDPRIKERGRNFLLSKRPTKKQYFSFFETLQLTFDELGLEADVDLLATRTNTNYTLRRGVAKYDTYPLVKSFPIE